MDLNYLLACERMKLLRASAADIPEARAFHEHLAGNHGARPAGSIFPHRSCLFARA